MSSFVIGKQEFIKVAGFCAGLADCKNNFHEPVLRIWNYNTGKVYEAEDFYRAFVWLYKLNALSVKIQYNDPQPEDDPEEYKTSFAAYRAKARKAYNSFDNQKIIEGIYKAHKFFDCLLYQVEDKDCEQKIKGFIYRIDFEFMDILQKLTWHDEDGWGDFEI